MNVIAFDLFGTVFNLAGVPREEICAYLDLVTQDDWKPLRLPASWERLPAFGDAAEGILRLRTKFIVVTCSNAPLGFQTRLLKHSRVRFDGVIPLELNEVYKPDPLAYLTICDVLGVEPQEVTMVTGNPTFAHYSYGDAQKAAELGMTGQLIRHDGCPRTIIELAEKLGC